MDTDERFKHLAADPRFRKFGKKERKVQIDERFQSMFTDEKFTLKYSRDKRGRKLDHGKDKKKDKKKANEVAEELDKLGQDEKTKDASTDHDKEVDDEEDTDVDDEEDDQVDDEVDNEEDTDEDADEASELSSSSDESESDDEQDPIQGVEYDWQSLDHDAERADRTTKRIALQHMDWDHLDVRDIYTLVNSIRPPIRVRIYVSEFGKERLKQEETEGPKELVDLPKIDEEEEEYKMLEEKMKAMENPAARTFKANDYEDADEALDPRNLEIRERIRKYQLSRMKYYYAVAEFDSVESAEAVYKELDGLEYEGSSLELDLRFIPDDIEFDDSDIKAECDKLPDLTSYKAPLFINTALQQTTVKLTWDETDIKRQEKLQRAYTKEELDKDDLEAYLASETETESEEDEDGNEDGATNNNADAVSVVTANSEARANKYRQLLKSLDEEADKKKKIDVDVEWGNYSDDEAQQTVDRDKYEEYSGEDEECDFSDSESDDHSDQVSTDGGHSKKRDGRKGEPKNSMSKKEKKLSKKKKKGNKTKQQLDDGKAGNESDGNGELDLLVMDAQSERDEFKFNPDDDRFRAVYESGLYNIDPSHPNFKRTQAFDMIAEKKREKRRKTSS